jgi:hypothetical protein
MSKRFWRGRKRQAKKAFKSVCREMGMWNYLYAHGLPKAGDITHNCDGLNHKIDTVDIEWLGWKTGRVPLISCSFSKKGLNGYIVCPCLGMGFQIPLDAKEVAEYLQAWTSPENRKLSEEFSMGISDMGDKLVSGQARIDENGLFTITVDGGVTE